MKEKFGGVESVSRKENLLISIVISISIIGLFSFYLIAPDYFLMVLKKIADMNFRTSVPHGYLYK